MLTTTPLMPPRWLTRVQNMKYLGVSSKTDFLGRLSKKKLTSKSKLLIFCSTIIFIATEEEICDLKIIQNRVLRLILKEGPRTSVEWMLNAVQMMPVKQRVCFNTLDLIYKLQNNKFSQYMPDPRNTNCTQGMGPSMRALIVIVVRIVNAF
jgi:hypothetical protein